MLSRLNCRNKADARSYFRSNARTTATLQCRRQLCATRCLILIALGLVRPWGGIPAANAQYIPCPVMDLSDCVTLACEPSTCPVGFSAHDSSYCAAPVAGSNVSTTQGWYYGAIWICCRVVLGCDDLNKSPPPPMMPPPPGQPQPPGL